MKKNGRTTPTKRTLSSSSRRNFIKTAVLSAGGLLLSGVGFYKYFGRLHQRKFPGKIVGASSSAGHLIRDGKLPYPTKTEEVETVIVGGGISGLSAAWWLTKNEYKNYTLLELENHVGGNSQSGKNEVSRYPWGAHYLPMPGVEAKFVFEFLEDIKVIQGYDSKKLPIYNELYLCSDPHERLYIQGRWQEGMVPQTGISQKDRQQYNEFFSLMEKYKNAKGSDGRRAFVIPVDLSSQDSEFLSLDKITMAEFLKEHGWDSKYLNWYINYCCRDDFGMGYEFISAWAGVHYFASRNGRASNADSQTVLTWPEGNGFLAEKLRERVDSNTRTGSLVFSVESQRDQVLVDYFDITSKQSTRIIAKEVIFASPRFVGARIIEEFKKSKPEYLNELRYAPWMVANVTLSSMPGGSGVPLSWDNVSFYSESLGYVVATHQNISEFPQAKTVVTYYFPLAQTDPTAARQDAFKKNHSDWAEEIASDLAKMHPGIEDQIENIDVWLWGHGMISPGVGYIWGENRQKMLASHGHIHFGHSDMSGISIFEEAQFHGVKAAQKVLAQVSHPKGSVS